MVDYYTVTVSDLSYTIDTDNKLIVHNGITEDASVQVIFNNNYVISNNQFTKEELSSEYIGSFNCLPGFITDVGVNPSISTKSCNNFPKL